MEVQEILEEARKGVGAQGVYGEPYRQNGITVIPAVATGGGGGGGQGGEKELGGGFGFVTRPKGAWVIEGNTVRWKTALDLNRVILGAELVALVGIFAARTIFAPRRRVIELRRPPRRLTSKLRFSKLARAKPLAAQRFLRR
jgi:hypothetical protein